MSIAGLSSNSVGAWSQQTQPNPFQEVKQDFEQLAGALQSGDLSEAQSAYSSIQQVLQGVQGTSNTNAGSNNPDTLQTDFATLGQALQSGNLTQAQSAFAQLENDFQANQPSTGGAGAPAGQDQYVAGAQTQATAQETPAQQAQQDYTQLANALQAGSLTGAQSAFAALQQLVQPQGGSNSGTSTDPITNDFNALGQALSSGNLTHAQSAFAQLESVVQVASQNGTQAQNGTQVHGHHHHHHHGGGGSPSLTSSTQSSASSTSTTDNASVSGSTTNINIYA